MDIFLSSDMQYSMIFVNGNEIFTKTGHRESEISLKIQLVVLPSSRYSPHFTHWECAENSFNWPGKNKRGTYRGVIVVSGKNT